MTMIIYYMYVVQGCAVSCVGPILQNIMKIQLYFNVLLTMFYEFQKKTEMVLFLAK